MTYRIMMVSVFVIGVCQLSGAQSFRDRVEALQRSYADMDRVHIKMSIQVYTDVNSTKPYHQEEAEVKRDGKLYAYQYGALSMLMNNDYLVMVNKSSHEILWNKRSVDQQQKLFSDPFKTNLDSILNRYEMPLRVGAEGSVEHYRIEQRKGDIRQVDLFIDTVGNVLKRLEYRYVDKYYVVIDFNLFDKAPTFGPETFRESRYIWKDRGEFKAAEAFRGYRVIANNTF